jgi:hypothetical protein
MTVANKIPDVTEILYYSETSPSGLRWAVDRGSRAKKHSTAGSRRKDGYWVVRISGVLFLAHRIVWQLCTKNIPENMVINHIDNDPSNNSIDNLEMCTKKDNSNRAKMHTGKGLRTDNTSGINNIMEIDNGCGNLYARVKWDKDGQKLSRSFSYTKLGKEEAWKQAIAFQQSLLV